MAISLKTYKENKEVLKNLKTINEFFIEKYPEKSAGWVGITALFYSQTAIMHYIEKAQKLDKDFIPAIKAILWDFLNEVSRSNTKEKEVDRHE